MSAARSARRVIALASGILAAAALLAVAPGQVARAVFSTPAGVQTSFASTAAVPLDFAGVDAGDDYSLGWTADGRLYAWGANDRGQLGVGDTTSRSIPTLVAFPFGVAVAEASAGINMSIAVTTTGDVYTWGNSDVTTGVTRPGLVPSLSGLGVVGVSAGGYFFLAWTSDGRLYSWGNSGGGRLGRAAPPDMYTPGLVTAQGLNTRSVTSASAGRFFGIASVDGGAAVVGFGSLYGATGGVTFSGLPSDSPVSGLTAGNAFVFAWTGDGRLYSGASTSTLTQETTLAGTDVVGAVVSVPSTGASSFYAWDAQHTLYAWGLNASGQLGLGDTADRASPTAVTLPPGVTLLTVAAGNAHALQVATGGEFSAAGSNTSGQLGTDDTASRTSFSTPVLIVRWP
ncbi:RCC1 domain-containing protein [Leifsonia sp. EB34]|uniref:RCC1 domain-containing protein n=1 Tax=Leifsonia sp. EB34 TaxID=3156303 RepID=UPI0035157D9C